MLCTKLNSKWVRLKCKCLQPEKIQEDILAFVLDFLETARTVRQEKSKGQKKRNGQCICKPICHT